MRYTGLDKLLGINPETKFSVKRNYIRLGVKQHLLMPAIQGLLNQIFEHHGTDIPFSILCEYTHATDESVRQQSAGTYDYVINYRLDVLAFGVLTINLQRGRYILLFDENPGSQLH